MDFVSTTASLKPNCTDSMTDTERKERRGVAGVESERETNTERQRERDRERETESDT